MNKHEVPSVAASADLFRHITADKAAFYRATLERLFNDAAKGESAATIQKSAEGLIGK